MLPSRTRVNEPQQHQELVVAAAVLYYQDNRLQAEIADALQISRSYVSKLLQEAISEGIVDIRIRYPLAELPEIGREVAQRFGIRAAHVLAHTAEVPGPLDSLGRLAGRVVNAELRPGDRIGLSWGRSIHAMVRGLLGPSVRGLQIVQLGGSLGNAGSETDGRELARQAAERLDAQVRYMLTPLTVETETIRDIMLDDAHIARGIKAAESCTVTVVGIGAATADESSILSHPALAQEREAIAGSGARGEILSQFFDGEGRLVDLSLHRRLLVASLIRLRANATMIGVAAGAQKAEALLAALKGGWLDVIVIDERLARALLRLRPA